MQRMSAAEETHWQAYYRASPFGDHRADVRNAQVLQLLYNVHAGKKASKKSLTDWMPFFRKRVKEDPDIGSKAREMFANVAKFHSGKK